MTVDNFRFVGNSDDLYVPKVDVLKSTKRTILMEYVEGIKIDDIDALNAKFGSAKDCTDVLISIFAKMLFPTRSICGWFSLPSLIRSTAVTNLKLM